RSQIAEAQAAEEALVPDADAAQAELHRCRAALADAGNGLRDAEAERRSWSARADALAMALDEARARAGAERLAEAHVTGVVGTLIELVEVDAGWEAAFESAAGEAIAAVVVANVAAARACLTA